MHDKHQKMSQNIIILNDLPGKARTVLLVSRLRKTLFKECIPVKTPSIFHHFLHGWELKTCCEDVGKCQSEVNLWIYTWKTRLKIPLWNHQNRKNLQLRSHETSIWLSPSEWLPSKRPWRLVKTSIRSYQGPWRKETRSHRRYWRCRDPLCGGI